MLKRMMYMTLGGLLALALVFGAAATLAFQTDDEAVTTPEEETDAAQEGDAEAEDDSDDATSRPRGLGPHGPGRGASDEALAAALGISVEELAAAHEEAFAAVVAQAVAEGLITQEQADELLARAEGFRGRFRPGFGALGDKDEYLAAALGISVDELRDARIEAHNAWLAELVAAGTITQEQADLMAARHAVQSYVDREALQAAAQAVYEAAVNEALAAGVISQEQADTLLENGALNFDFGFRGFGGRGHHHGPGGRGGGWFFRPPAESVTPEGTAGDA